MPSSRTLLLAVMVTATAACDAQAQVIRGRLLDQNTNTPIAAGAVALRVGRTPGRAVLTDTLGWFMIKVPRSGNYMLQGSAFGYRTAVTPGLSVIGNDTIDVELRLDTDAVPLAPLTITARRSTKQRLLEDFEHRRKVGFGQFLGPEDLERMVPFHASDVLRGMRGVELFADRSQVTVAFRDLSSRYCIPHIVVDGFSAPEGIPLNELVSASRIRAVEVYRLASDVPAEFASVVRRGCGALVVWTDWMLPSRSRTREPGTYSAR